MESIRAEAKKLNDEQEKLKADLKSKTDALNAKMEELTQKYSEAKGRLAKHTTISLRVFASPCRQNIYFTFCRYSSQRRITSSTYRRVSSLRK